MQNLIFGDTADECLVKSMKMLNKHGSIVSGTETLHRSSYPVTICLTNPLARFSFLSGEDPRMSILLGISALAGINIDDLLYKFSILHKSLLPGPYIRGFNSEQKSYHVTSKNAGTRIGNTDQFGDAVRYLNKNPIGSFTFSLRDPRKENYHTSGNAASFHLSFDAKARLSASVYFPKLDISKYLCEYVISTFTFVQEIAGALLGKTLGNFYVVSDEIRYFENEKTKVIIGKSIPRIKEIKEFRYEESKTFDLRYLDMVIQHMMDFFRRVTDGDVSINNPLKDDSHLGIFHDYGEFYRQSEILQRKIPVNGKPEIKHPQLAYFYNF